MRVSDFILQARSDLQEKTQHWSDEELLIKLKRAYIAFQEDLPFFIDEYSFAIEKGKREYYPTYRPKRPVKLTALDEEMDWVEHERLYKNGLNNVYTFYLDRLLLKTEPLRDGTATLVYKYIREIDTKACNIELPSEFLKALRLLFLAEVHEKPTRNSKERNLSKYYYGEYERELDKLKVKNRHIPKGVKSNYQII